ncbi:unnamed protein product [Caenorhabditis nigoni]
MKLILLTLIFYLIACFDSRKLTSEENEKRLEQCGITVKPKVFRGKSVRKNEAPWAVMVHTLKSDGSAHCSGTVISPRHILTATHCSANGNKKEWIETDVNFPVKKEECSNGEHLTVTEVTASKVTVLSRNETTIGRAKFLYMLQFCRKILDDPYIYQTPDDFMIVELAEDLEYTSEIQPACFARDINDNALGTDLDFFGYGDNPPAHLPQTPASLSKHRLLYHKAKVAEYISNGVVLRMESRLFTAKSVNYRTTICSGDSGGGAITQIDGRNTVVGVAMSGSCAKMVRGKDALEIFASAGFYADEICELTGICTPPRGSAEKESHIEIVMVLIFLYIVYIE